MLHAEWRTNRRSCSVEHLKGSELADCLVAFLCTGIGFPFSQLLCKAMTQGNELKECHTVSINMDYWKFFSFSVTYYCQQNCYPPFPFSSSMVE
ncbi:unnamed protein product [Urochloa humidicola]